MKGFGLAPIALEGTPVHPIDCGLDNPHFDKQLIRYFDFWIARGDDMSEVFGYEQYLKLKKETK